jgi:predicted NBD/HSP70 family sugar kinase
MDYFAGLDVSVKETSICIVDDTGKIVREEKVASEPQVLLAVLKNSAYHFRRVLQIARVEPLCKPMRSGRTGTRARSRAAHHSGGERE